MGKLFGVEAHDGSTLTLDPCRGNTLRPCKMALSLPKIIRIDVDCRVLRATKLYLPFGRSRTSRNQNKKMKQQGKHVPNMFKKCLVPVESCDKSCIVVMVMPATKGLALDRCWRCLRSRGDRREMGNKKVSPR